jgi:glucosamine--fructose-6-phosphate aminotransferase (isomerizing)
MDTTRFLDDLTLVPAALDALADRLDEGVDALASLPPAARVLIVGMGSSLYAAAPVARRARAQGLNVSVELASTVELPPPAADLVVIAISATGGSAEVLAAVAPYAGLGRLVALTNRADSALAALADVVVPLHAGVEASGVACRTFRHTAVVLSAVLVRYGLAGETDAAGLARKAASANRHLLDTRDLWLADAARILGGPHGTWTLAPVERLASAQQSALMMREVPRRPAYSSETGDWSHVDVYLTKTLDYRALLFAGSAWDAAALDWMAQRGSTFVAVGRELPGAALTIRYPGDDDPLVAVLTEVLVGELVAQRWFAESGEGVPA